MKNNRRFFCFTCRLTLVKILRLKGIFEVENHKIRISEDFTAINHDYFFEKT